MSEFFFDIANIHGQNIQFKTLPFSEHERLTNMPGVAVIIKKDFYGWHRLFKIQSHSLGHALRTERVQRRVEPDNFYFSYHIAFLPCDTPQIRITLYEEVAVSELNE
jgi:hypothetical protein